MLIITLRLHLHLGNPDLFREVKLLLFELHLLLDKLINLFVELGRGAGNHAILIEARNHALELRRYHFHFVLQILLFLLQVNVLVLQSLNFVRIADAQVRLRRRRL